MVSRQILVGSSLCGVCMLVVADVGESAPSMVTVMCEGVPSDSGWDFVEPQSFSFSKKRYFACVEEQEDMNYEGTLVKAPPCTERRMRTPLPEQSSFSSMEEGSPLERTGKCGCCKDGAVREQQ